MPALQVRDVPADVYDDLKRIAAEQDRSLSQQTLHALRVYIASQKQLTQNHASSERREPSPQSLANEEAERQKRIEKRKAIFARLDELHAEQDLSHCPVPGGFESDAEMIRADREERTNRILAAVEGLQ